MKVPFKLIGVSACVLVSALCGCGDKRSKSATGSKEESKSDSGSKEKSKAESGTEPQNSSEEANRPLPEIVISAKASAMSLLGSKFVRNIIQANIDRQGKVDPLWPKTVVDAGNDNDADISGRAFKSAPDYFNALFDMQHHGTADWEPYVNGDLLSMLFWRGVQEMPGNRQEIRNVAWTVAANVTDETPDFIPVLITANFNPSLLLSKWDGKTNGSERLPIGPASGAAATPLGDKTIVIVRKNGYAEMIMANDLTYDRLYKGMPFDLTNTSSPLMYLTPTGVVEPVGHR